MTTAFISSLNVNCITSKDNHFIFCEQFVLPVNLQLVINGGDTLSDDTNKRIFLSVLKL